MGFSFSSGVVRSNEVYRFMLFGKEFLNEGDVYLISDAQPVPSTHWLMSSLLCVQYIRAATSVFSWCK